MLQVGVLGNQIKGAAMKVVWFFYVVSCLCFLGSCLYFFGVMVL